MSLFIDKLTISSPDFDPLSRIPDEFTADGGHTVPRLEFSGLPEGTVELSLVCHDPDAPLPHGFTHFVVHGIPPESAALDLVDERVRVAPNGANSPAWYGPEPPHGHGEHHYYFWLYALSRPVTGTPSREQFLADYADAIIEQARFVGLYSR